MGKSIGSRMLDVLVLREKGYKRETRIINVLLFIKTTVWKVSECLLLFTIFMVLWKHKFLLIWCDSVHLVENTDTKHG